MFADPYTFVQEVDTEELSQNKTHLVAQRDAVYVGQRDAVYVGLGEELVSMENVTVPWATPDNTNSLMPVPLAVQVAALGQWNLVCVRVFWGGDACCLPECSV